MIVRATLLVFIVALASTGFVRGDGGSAPSFSDLLAANPKLNRWLKVEMPEFGGGPVKSYTASQFQTSQLVWQDGAQAIYYATALPPTEFTCEEVGVLIAVRRGGDGKWRVMKSLGFESIGREAGTKLELSSYSRSGHGIPVVTVTLEQGGREENYAESFTYSMEDDNFRLHQPGSKKF